MYGILDIESGGNDSALVDSPDEFNNDLLGSMVIDDFEFADVSVLLHDSQEFYDHLGNWADEHLFSAGLLGINDSS